MLTSRITERTGPLVDALEIADIACVEPSTVTKWRTRPNSTFPPAVLLDNAGRAVAYDRDEVTAWLDARRQERDDD